MQDQSIYEKLREYAKSDAYPFHMPGHKRKVDWISDVYNQHLINDYNNEMQRLTDLMICIMQMVFLKKVWRVWLMQ